MITSFMRRLHFVLTETSFSKNKVQDQNSSANEALSFLGEVLCTSESRSTSNVFHSESETKMWGVSKYKELLLVGNRNRAVGLMSQRLEK